MMELKEKMRVRYTGPPHALSATGTVADLSNSAGFIGVLWDGAPELTYHDRGDMRVLMASSQVGSASEIASARMDYGLSGFFLALEIDEHIGRASRDDGAGTDAAFWAYHESLSKAVLREQARG